MDVNEVHYKNAHIQMFTLLKKKNHCRILFLPNYQFYPKNCLIKSEFERNFNFLPNTTSLLLVLR